MLSNEAIFERLRRATIGRYDIYAELGVGGMATVFLALDLALDRKVAIKVLNPQLAAAPDHIERFKREAKVAASLNHPNIIGILAVGDDPELAYFVMKYIEGRALDSVMRDLGAQSVPFVRSVISVAGKALYYAHQRGIVHRDVKPANFMLDKDGWLIVTDFGIAKLEDAKGLTVTGSVMGTPYYMAPEQFQGMPVTPAADQYALGVVAFELLTGRQPFEGDTLAEVMKGHLFDPIPSVRSLRPDVPESVDAAISRMLAKDPALRFESLELAVDAFGAVTSTQENEVRTQMINLALSGAMEKPQIHVPVSALVPLPPQAEAARKPRSPWIIAVLALLVGGALATVALRPDLVNRMRKSLASGQGDLADTAQIVLNESSRREMPTPSVDPAKREREIRDSVEQAVAAQLRDSLALVDSLRRAGSDVTAATILTRRQRLQQLVRDSLAARNRLDTAVRAPALPNEIPSSMIYGTVRIGSNCPTATLYVGELVRPIGRMGLQDIGQLSGSVRLEVRTRAGARWDTTMTVESGVTYTLGNRPLRCQ